MERKFEDGRYYICDVCSNIYIDMISIYIILHMNTSRWFNDSMRFSDGRSSEFGTSLLKGHTFYS